MDNSIATTNQDRPLITFALFAYNQEKYIEEAVQGAFSQTYSPLEIILSDDCSTDRTFEIMQRMANEYQGPHKIVLNRNESNLGITPHFNKLILELSHGELIVLAAGDDISLPERTKKIWLAWEETDRKAFGFMCGLKKMDGNKVFFGSPIMPEPGLKDDGIFNCLHKSTTVTGAAFAFQRDLCVKFGPLTTAPAEDVNTFYRAMMMGGVVGVKEILVHWRAVGVCSGKDVVQAYRNRIKHKPHAWEQLIEDLNSDTARSVLTPNEIDRAILLARKLLAVLRQEQSAIEGSFFKRIKAWALLFSTRRDIGYSYPKRLRAQYVAFPFLFPQCTQTLLYTVVVKPLDGIYGRLSNIKVLRKLTRKIQKTGFKDRRQLVEKAFPDNLKPRKKRQDL